MTTAPQSALVFVKARATRWVSDEPFPGLVEVELTDGSGKAWTFVDKYPMFGPGDDLRPDGRYPINLTLACTVIDRTSNTVTISTAQPWGLESVNGTYHFVMRPDQIVIEPD